MQVEDLRDVIERKPFRRIAIRLNNGGSYQIDSARDVGAFQDYSGAVRIDSDAIDEMIESD